MPRLGSIIALIVLALSMEVFAQRHTELEFAGIPFGVSRETVVEELMKMGYDTYDQGGHTQVPVFKFGDLPVQVDFIFNKNEKFYAFLDINPVAKGHTLVIPRREVDYIFDMDDDELAEFEVFAKQVAVALKKAFPCKKVAQVVLGLEVPHAHIHLIPMNSEGDVDFRKEKLHLPNEEMQQIADKILAEFSK